MDENDPQAPNDQVFTTQDEALRYLLSLDGTSLVTQDLMNEAAELVGTPIPTAFPPEEEQSP